MALVHADRVKETSTTTGTGTYNLAGAATGFQTFVAGIGTGNTCYYVAEDGTNWEVGIGTVTDASPDTLARTSVIKSSNSNNAVDWAAGTRNLFVSPIAPKFVGLDDSPTWTGSHIIAGAGTWPAVLTLKNNDNGATGPFLGFWANSATPAASDYVGGFSFDGNDSAANRQAYSSVNGGILDPTSTSEDGFLDIWAWVAGVDTKQVVVSDGVYLGTATGGAKGAGTLNATALYEQGDLISGKYFQLAAADQSITGGARIVVNDLGNLSGVTITPDPGDRPIQKITNNGAGTIAPGSNVGSYILIVKNTTGAGAITTSGWQDVSGETFDTTTTSEFVCHCTITGDLSAMVINKVA